jgi:hypothetical protein
MNQEMAIVVVMAIVGVSSTLQARPPQTDREIRLNVVVSSTGNLRNDGKGTYRTGEDYVAAWVNPSRWPEMSFDICMNWPFSRYPGVDAATAPAPSGTRDTRTLVHRMTDPVPQGGGRPMGVFTGPGGGNDVALPKPLTSTMTSLTDMAIGTSLSPQSAEVRFCNSNCSEVYSLLFGDKSVFGYPKITGAGTTRPIVSRTSETAWTISFPPRTVGRLWDRTTGRFRTVPTSEDETDLGLYYYEGSLSLEILKQ